MRKALKDQGTEARRHEGRANGAGGGSRIIMELLERRQLLSGTVVGFEESADLSNFAYTRVLSAGQSNAPLSQADGHDGHVLRLGYTHHHDGVKFSPSGEDYLFNTGTISVDARLRYYGPTGGTANGTVPALILKQPSAAANDAYMVTLDQTGGTLRLMIGAAKEIGGSREAYKYYGTSAGHSTYASILLSGYTPVLDNATHDLGWYNIAASISGGNEGSPVAITAKVTAPEGTSYYGQWSDTGSAAWTETGTVGIAQYSQWSQAGEFDNFTVDDEVTLFTPPVVSIEANVQSVHEGSITPGAYTLRRTGSTDGDLRVNVAFQGTARIGDLDDYTLDPMPQGTGGQWYTILAGQDYLEIALDARADNLVEGDEDVILQLLSGGGYAISGTGEAGATIKDMTVDLDIDSDSNDGTAEPDRSDAEDQIEDMPDDEAHPGKLIQSNSEYDNDNDLVPDFADGFNLDGIPNNTDDAQPDTNLAPLVLKLPAQLLLTAKIRIGYEASDPSQSVRSDGSYNAGRGLRLWYTRGPFFGTASYFGPREYNIGDLPVGADGQTVRFLVEGVGLSPQWGDQRITVDVDLDGNGVYDTSDAVRLSLIDTRLRVFAVQPYVVVDGHKVFFQMDYGGPQSMRDSALYGFTHSDSDGPDTGWHSKDSWMGHAFSQLSYNVPGQFVQEYFGSTGQEEDQWLLTLWSSINGTIPWQRFNGHQNTIEELSPWLNNNNLIFSTWNPDTQTLGPPMKLVQDHTWIVKPSVARDLNELLQPYDQTTRPHGRNYSTYGLDIEATEGGCASLVGAAMELVGFSETAGWKRLNAGQYAPINAFMDLSAWSKDDDERHDPLKFYEPTRLANWMLIHSDNFGFTNRIEESTWNGTKDWRNYVEP